MGRKNASEQPQLGSRHAFYLGEDDSVCCFHSGETALWLNGSTQRKWRSPGRWHQQSGWQPHSLVASMRALIAARPRIKPASSSSFFMRSP